MRECVHPPGFGDGMEFNNHFTVTAPIGDVWALMLNAQEVAPCVPGAQITEVIDDTHYKGTVKVKLGAVQMTYRGELEMQADESSHTLTLRAKGTETRGSGGASGTNVIRLTDEAGSTRVDIQSTVEVSGRVAQFGRGIMQDVANRLIKEFATCLEQKVQPGGADGGAPQSEASAQPPAATAPAAGELETATTATPTATVSHGPAPTPAPTPPTAPPETAAHLNLQDLIVAVVRSRTAAALRALAAAIEPK